MTAMWKSNLADALLMDPLVLLHGNVKDIYTIDEPIRSRLPAEWSDQRTVTFDLWLALELERQGYDIVCLYDNPGGIVVLRRPMLATLHDLMAGGPRSAASPRPPASAPWHSMASHCACGQSLRG